MLELNWASMWAPRRLRQANQDARRRKNVAGKEFRKENEQFQAAHCFSSFLRIGLVFVELASAELSWTYSWAELELN